MDSTRCVREGRELLGAGAFEAAVPWLRRALADRADSPLAWFLLGQALHQMGSLGEAQTALHHVLARQPQNGGALIELGRIAMARGDLSGARACLDRALASPRAMLDNRVAVGHLFARMGETGRAATCYRDVLSRRPAHGEALEGLAFLLRARLSASEEQAIDARLVDAACPLAERARLHHARAEIAAGRGDTPRQLSEATQANRLHREVWTSAGRAHDPAQHRRRIDEIIAAFGKARFSAPVRRYPGVPTRRPVFIVGLPRSGTSLIEQILVSHPDVFGGGELLHLGRLLDAMLRTPPVRPLAGVLDALDGITPRVAVTITRAVRSHVEFKGQSSDAAAAPVVGLHAVAPPRVGDLPGTAEDLHAARAKPIVGLPATDAASDPQITTLAQNVAREYLRRLSELSPTAARVTDKLPFNFLHVGWIERLFPEATIIHCRRDPRDVALSCFTKGLARVRWSADLHDIASTIEDHARLMAHWRSVLPGRIVEVDYERIVSDPEPETRRLLAACALPWHPACLTFHATERAVCTASTSQVREPMHTRSVGRWQDATGLLAPILPRLEALAETHTRAQVVI